MIHSESERNHSWQSDGWDSNYQVWRLINLGLIKKTLSCHNCPWTSEMAKEQERQVELPGVETMAFGFPCQVLCH